MLNSFDNEQGNKCESMQQVVESLDSNSLNIVLSMVDLDCLDSFPSVEQVVSAIEMFGYSEQDILDRLNSTNEFVFEDDFEYPVY